MALRSNQWFMEESGHAVQNEDPHATRKRQRLVPLPDETASALRVLLVSATSGGSDTVENSPLDHSKHTFFEILSKTTLLFENTLILVVSLTSAGSLGSVNPAAQTNSR